jgi:hypothetical protein
MRYDLLFIPAVAISASAMAEEYLTVEQAQALIFPGESLVESHFVLDDAQMAALVRATGAPLTRRQVRLWKSASGGWFFLDHVIVKGDRIVYAIGLNAAGAVQGVEILACLALYDGIRRGAWRTQFVGKRNADAAYLENLKGVSGSTLSSNNIKAGIKRMLAVHALFLAKGA